MIPKIIHYCWLSDEPYPDIVEKCMKSWSKLEGYQIMKWDKTTFDVDKYPFIKECCENGLYAFACDYIRLYALYNYGGIYLDTDVEVIKPFDDFILNRPYLLGKWKPGFIVATTMGCEKENPVIGQIKKYYEDNYLNKVVDYLNLHIMENEIAAALKGQRLNFIDSEYICPMGEHHPNFHHLIDYPSQKAYCVHYAASGWVTTLNLKVDSIILELNKKKVRYFNNLKLK